MGLLASSGFRLTGEIEDADAVLLTTCAFIRDAVSETEDVIENLLGLKAEQGRPLLAVAGCLVDRFAAEELTRRFPDVDTWFSGGDYLEVPHLLNAALKGRQSAAGRKGIIPALFEKQPRLPSTSCYAYLKVAEGCSNRCNYCTIPAIRGDYRPVPQKVLVEEAEALADMGVEEIILVAQDVARYVDPDTGEGLPHLVEAIADLDDLRWIRLMYLHPAHIRGALEAFTVSSKVLPYADLPIQHASDNVLDAMGRGYSKSDLVDTVEALRTLSKEMVLRTTLMVGHPGEREEDFEELLRFLDETRFLYAGAFVYSPEEGTASSGLERPDDDTARKRRDQLMRFQQRITFEMLDSYKGATLDAVPDEEEARTWFQAPEVDGMLLSDHPWPDGVFKAVVTGRWDYDLTGEPLE